MYTTTTVAHETICCSQTMNLTMRLLKVAASLFLWKTPFSLMTQVCYYRPMFLLVLALRRCVTLSFHVVLTICFMPSYYLVSPIIFSPRSFHADLHLKTGL